MNNSFLSIIIFSLLFSVFSHGVTFQTPMGDSQWAVDSSVFECKMTHSIPFYGEGVFYKEAGESAVFNLKPQSSRFKSGKASMVSEAPIWKQSGRSVDLGLVNVRQGMSPVTLGESKSERLLAELLTGQKVVFTRKPWYGAESSARVVLSSVNFRGAYRQYMDCLTSLLPVNFDQINRTAIYFPSGTEVLRPSEIEKLENIAIYIKADPTVQAFLVDGHTDGVGPRGENLELSKMRAEMVASILRDKGIPTDQITMRWHGERYPVTTNRTRVGRAQNRRVTIRLERSGTPKIPALASN
jgi:outer membrane protein OmpA-like peptidoglycan-associated protein